MQAGFRGRQINGMYDAPVRAGDNHSELGRRCVHARHLILANYEQVIGVLDVLGGWCVREPMPMSCYHQVHTRVVCGLDPGIGSVGQPAPSRLVHHDDTERCFRDAVRRSHVLSKPLELFRTVRRGSIQLGVHVRVIGLILARIEDHEMHGPRIPGVIEPSFRCGDVVEESAGKGSA